MSDSLDHARDVVAATSHASVEGEQDLQRASFAPGVRRRSRQAETRITDPQTHRRRYVSLVVAAEYLEVDRKTLNIYLLDRKLAFTTFGRRRKIEVAELVAFEQRQRTAAKAG